MVFSLFLYFCFLLLGWNQVMLDNCYTAFSADYKKMCMVFFLPFLALTICSSIDGAARIFLSDFLSLHSGNSISLQLLCLVPFFTNHLRPEREEKYHLNFATRPNYADGGNRTCATSTVLSITQLPPGMCVLIFLSLLVCV